MIVENTPAITTVLGIGGHGFSTDDLTSLAGVKPTQIWHQQHEWVKVTHPDFATIEWRYKLEKQRKWSLGEAIDELLNVFWSKRDEINLFLSRNRLEMTIDVRPFGDASTLEYIIQPEVIRKLAFFGVSLSLAVYKDDL